MSTIKTILLVEDDWVLASYWRSLLEEAGYQVLHQSTVSTAIKVLESTHVDLVICDIVIEDEQGYSSDQGGLEVISYIALNLNPLPRIIVVSGAVGESAFVDRNFGRLNSLVALRKPVSDRKFLESVKVSFESTAKVSANLATEGTSQDNLPSQTTATKNNEAIELLKATQFRLKQTQFSLDHAPDGVYWIDENARFVYTNLRNCELLGYTREELLSKTIVDISPAVASVEFFQQNIAPRITESGITFERELLRKDGSTFAVEVSARLLIYEGERLICAYIRDISERILATAALKSVSESRRAMVELLGSTDGVWDCDLIANTVEFQPGYRKLLGYDQNDRVGMPDAVGVFVQNLHPDDRDRIIAAQERALRSDGLFDEEFRLKKKDGTYIWVHDRAATIFDDDGKAVRMTGSIYDITEAKKVAAALERERRLLEESNADLQQFASVASHDLQEPLRAVSGFLQLIEKKYADQLDERGRGYIQKSVAGASRMSQLINDLLLFSRVSRSPESFAAVDLNEVVIEAQQDLEQAVETSQAQIETDALPTIEGTRPLLIQLFRNLIGNSIKYCSDATPRIEISSSVEDQICTIRFQDNGIGIPDEYRHQVFELFKRLHHREQHSGTGIGLAICRRAVERHGGSIDVEPNEQLGTCFVIRLPINGS